MEQVVEEAEEVVYEYVPPIPKDWISLGSERDIEEESLIENRKRVRFIFRRSIGSTQSSLTCFDMYIINYLM